MTDPLPPADPTDQVDRVRGRLEVLVGDRSDAEVALVSRVVAGFGPKARGLLAALAEAVTALDGTACVQQAHALKGAALTLGSVDLATACERLETRARSTGRLPEEHELGLLAAEVDRFVALLAEVGPAVLRS
jgi:HPt (histidine-containing phosphotransfer) domain-containing protein